MLNWLQQHYEWTATIVLGIIGIVIAWRQLRKKEDSRIALPESSVDRSTIAAGSGNNQNINAPVFNVNVGHPPSAPTPAKPPKTERPVPNLVYAGGKRKSVFISPSQTEGICDPKTEDQRENSVEAFILKFENRTRSDRKIGRALNVIAKLKFRHKNGATERDIDYGVWLNSPCNSTDIGIGDTRELVLFCVLDNRLVSFEDRRSANLFFGSEGFTYIQNGDVEDYDRVDITLIEQNSQASLSIKLRVWREGASFFSSEL